MKSLNNSNLALVLTAVLLFVFGLSASAQHLARSQADVSSKQEIENQRGTNSNTDSTGGAKIKAQIDFVVPLSVADAIQIAQQQNLTIIQLQHSFVIGDQKFVGIFPVAAGTSADMIAPELLASYRGFLQDIAH